MVESKDIYTLVTRSADETEKLGFVIAGMLPECGLVALRGELAAGKTCLVRGMAARLAANAVVSSPSFTLVNEYGEGPALYHLDLYRLTAPEQMYDLDWEELLYPSACVCAVEWADRAEAFMPETRLDVFIEHNAEDTRKFTLSDSGLLSPDWKEVLRNEVSGLDGHAPKIVG